MSPPIAGLSWPSTVAALTLGSSVGAAADLGVLLAVYLTGASPMWLWLIVAAAGLCGLGLLAHVHQAARFAHPVAPSRQIVLPDQPRALCPACRWSVRVTHDGVLERHFFPFTSKPCDGSGEFA